MYAREDLFVTREIAVPKSRSFLIGTFYRPDRTSSYYDKDFIFKLNNILDTATAKNQEILLCGDFNCCFLHAKRGDPDCKQLKSLFRCFDLKQLITKPTRINKDTKSLIELIAISHPQNIRDHGVITSHLSDHELVYCVCKINWRKAPSQIKIFRNYTNYDSIKFCADLRGVDWSIPNGQAASVENQWSEFKTSFISVADQHAPVVQKRVRGIDNCPWLNKQIKSFMRQRDKEDKLCGRLGQLSSF